jgi:stage II sporulation protein D
MAINAWKEETSDVRKWGLLPGLCVAALLISSPAQADKLIKAGQGKRVVISGGGWGHGIGMSQYGAYGRALNGKSAQQILTTYYTGVSVTSRTKPDRIRVGLHQARKDVAVTSKPMRVGGGKAVFRVSGRSGRLAKGPPGTTWRVEVASRGRMHLFKNGRRVKHNGRKAFGGPAHPLVMVYEKFGSLIDVEGKAHDYAYGRMQFDSYPGSCSAGYCLRLILSIPTQKYIYGLGEVPASWPAAALRAQAIASRTYAYSKIDRLGQHNPPCDCAVYDSTVDQAYIGDSKRTTSGEFWDDWKAAVDATNDQVILYNGDPIQALYSSSSGGYTENNENVWGGSPIPYLRGVQDGPDAVGANPNHTWKVKMKWSELSNKLNAHLGVGALRRLRLVPPFGVSGRVTVVKGPDRGGVKVVGAAKTARVDGWDVRQMLNLKDTLFRVKVK